MVGILLDVGAAARPSIGAVLSPQILKSLSIQKAEWWTFPAASDRKFWEGLSSPVRLDLVAQGEAELSAPWAPIPATVFLDFYRSGSKEAYQTASFGRRQRLGALVLAECVEGRGRFLDAIVDGIWAICEESFWGNSTNTWLQSPIEDQRKYGNMRLSEIRTTLPDVTKPGVDLWVGETAGLLTMTDYLLGARLDKVSPMVRPRIRLELQRRLLDPCLERDFRWMREKGNWNPWICSNWLATVLLVETRLEHREAAVRKIFAALDYYLANILTDGGCDEGPGYWRRSAATLFDCLELIYCATDGQVSIYDDPSVKELARFIYRMHIADDYFYNFNDSSGRMGVPSELATRFGYRIADSHLIAFGRAKIGSGEALSRSASLLRRVPALRSFAAGGEFPPATPPYVRDVWLPHLQVMTARSVANSTEGFFLAAKAGNNGESHNHNDVGDFVVFLDGKPVIVDIGPEAYTAANSGPNRYSIWTMSSDWHNLPTIGGSKQLPGAKYTARDVSYWSNEAEAHLSMELADAYPSDSGITSYVRSLLLRRDQEIKLSDRYSLSRSVDAISLSFITPCLIHDVGPGELQFVVRGMDKSVVMNYRGTLKVELETVVLKDPGLRQSWGDQLTRVLLVATNPERSDEWAITFRVKE